MDSQPWPGDDDTATWILVEGGGSRTTVEVTGPTPGRVDGNSTNPRSVGASAASEALGDLVAAVLALSATPADAVTFAVAAHGAASTEATAAEFAHLLADALRRCGVTAPVAVTGDILPLAFHLTAEVAVAAIVGTGTEFLARHSDRIAAASGLDFLLTDEGGGFDLGLRGLRATTRALDGRGPTTLLTTLARQWCAAPEASALRDSLFDKTYGAPARPTVASFARVVVTAADEGDPVAAGLVDDAVDEILAGIHAVLRGIQVGPDRALDLILSGSLATVHSAYRGRLHRRIAAELPAATITTHGDDALTPAVRRLGGFILRQQGDLRSLQRAGPAVFLC